MNASDLHAVPAAPATVGSGLTLLSNRTIGAILIDEGRLRREEVENVLNLQYERNLLFGDAAVKLGLATQADVEFALSLQFGYPYIVEGQSGMCEELVAAYHPFSTQGEALRALRNQLMLCGFDSRKDRRVLAITSAGRKEGRSFIAANLAVMFSQQGQRTLLIDADMRHPSQHHLFNLNNRSGLSAILSGRNLDEAIQAVPPFSDLSVLPAGSRPPNPLELLGRNVFGHMLREKAMEFDVVLIDTPAGSLYADAQTVARRADGALVVVRQNMSRVVDTRRMIDTLSRGGTTIVGTAVNEF